MTSSALPRMPAIVTGFVGHTRREPIQSLFRHRVYQWLVDLDYPPQVPRRLRPFVGFDARDHLGGTRRGDTTVIKQDVERFLAYRGVELGPGGRVVMLAHARVLGYVFDPLTVFWCFAADGTPRCVVAEVHNTYRDRHAYLLEPDSSGRAQVDKQLYVSPFNDVSGRYTLRFRLTRDDVRVDVVLRRNDRLIFDATFHGCPTPATPKSITRAVVRMPLMPQRVSALIRAHGIRLWLRRPPVADRPTHRRQKGT